MTRLATALAATVAAASTVAAAQDAVAPWQIPDTDAIAALIAQRNAPRAGQGIVVGVIEPGSERVIVGGPAEGPAFGGDTVFEIGSISKVFTALILADMANKGEVALDDPAEKYLPPGATMPERGGKKITLRDLSTHVSGLPRLPENMPLADIDDPYADYTDQLMLDFLASYELPRDIGAQFEYSNFAVGLLGWLLCRAAGEDYDTLLRERITGPLGMADTSVALSPEQQARFAQGFDPFMRPGKPWHFVQPGAGGIRSTADDMLKFAAAALDPSSPIGPAMKTALSVRVPGNVGYEQALGWQVGKQPGGGELLIHNGGTGAFRSVIALLPANGTAVVAFANSAAEPATTDLGLHILAGFPLAATPAVPGSAAAADRPHRSRAAAERTRTRGRAVRLRQRGAVRGQARGRTAYRPAARRHQRPGDRDCPRSAARVFLESGRRADPLYDGRRGRSGRRRVHPGWNDADG
jgi:CubicO group peptidase (beta-lactamase class C family)